MQNDRKTVKPQQDEQNEVILKEYCVSVNSSFALYKAALLLRSFIEENLKLFYGPDEL